MSQQWHLYACANVRCPTGPAEENYRWTNVSAHLLRNGIQRTQYLYREFACTLLVKR